MTPTYYAVCRRYFDGIKLEPFVFIPFLITFPMLKSLVACLLLVSSSVVFGCDRACSAVSDRNGNCYYQCSEGVCHMSASHHRDQFLTGLGGAGYDCRPNGAGGVYCPKTPEFGDCYAHYWSCGAGC